MSSYEKEVERVAKLLHKSWLDFAHRRLIRRQLTWSKLQELTREKYRHAARFVIADRSKGVKETPC